MHLGLRAIEKLGGHEVISVKTIKFAAWKCMTV